MAPLSFPQPFRNDATAGDSISFELGGVTFTATLHHDPNSDAPDQNQDGFWPSHDPKNAGYPGAEIAADADLFEAACAKAREVMQAWSDDEWSYVGVAVTAHIQLPDSEVCVDLVDEYECAVWGTEDTRYPADDRGASTAAHLTELANQELTACAALVAERLGKLESVLLTARHAVELAAKI